MNISDESNNELLLNTTIAPDYLSTSTTKSVIATVINISTFNESIIKVTINSTSPTTTETITIKESSTTAATATNNTAPSTFSTITTATNPPPTIRRTPKRSQSLVLCQCGSGEVMNSTGQCQHMPGGTTVPTEVHQRMHPRSTTYFNVTIDIPKCLYQQIDLKVGEFMLRGRGDLLMFKGAFRGFRVERYCIHHRLIEKRVEVTARGCVPQPVIPRCCAKCDHMENGKCFKNPNSSKPFKPYLATPPFDETKLAGVAFPWDSRQECVDNPTCPPGHIIKKVEMDENETYLAVVPQNVLLSWLTDDGPRQYSFPHDYCVDAQDNGEKYYANVCDWNPEAYCKDRNCTIKCCPEGHAVAFATGSCVPYNTTFNPPFIRIPSPLETLHRWPRCSTMTNISNFQILTDGTLSHREKKYPLSKFCIDNFIMGDSVETGGLVCPTVIAETTWHMVRKMLFPVCLVLSCVALVLLILLHIWIPKLMEKEGKYQLFHAVSLFLAYSATFAVQILAPKGYAKGNTCIILAFVMQFAFLSAFFWLNTMCFDVWRLFRNLVRSMYSAHTIVSVWKYVLYALGGPLIITVITIIMQYVAPDDGSVPGLVHPHIGEQRCWFGDDKALSFYFYGPIAVLFLLNFIFIAITYHYLKIIRGDYKSKNDPSEYTINSKEITRKYNFFSAFWQRFYLLVVMATLWLTEILSWKIPPEEMWAATDILNNLQGVFVFFIFLSHHNKRALLKEKLPKLFKFSEICINHAKTAHTSINNSTKRLSRKISSSSILSNMSTFSSFSTSSSRTSSFSLSENEPSISSTPTSVRSLSLARKSSKPLDHSISHGPPLADIPQNHILNGKHGDDKSLFMIDCIKH